MEKHKIQIGDLVSIEPWDCEGIENPSGYVIYDKKHWDPHKKKMFEKLQKKVKITPGSKALVTGIEIIKETYSEEHYYWCLVEGRQLIVSHRFIAPV